jgi:hypothetical protein
MMNTAERPIDRREPFALQNLEDPIIPATPDTTGVAAVIVGIIFLAMVPGVVDTNIG